MDSEIDALMANNPLNLQTRQEAVLTLQEILRMLKLTSFQIDYHAGHLRTFLSTIIIDFRYSSTFSNEANGASIC